MMKERNSNSKRWRERETLEELYLEKDLSSVEIAKRLDCSTPTVCEWLKKFGIEVQSNSVVQYEELADEDWLRHQHISEDKPANEIADMLGCSESTVQRWVNKHGIENRLSAPKDEDRLRKLYWENGLLITEVAERIGRSPDTVRRWFDQLGIERRDNEFRAKQPDLEVLAKEYEEDMKNTIELGEKYGVSDATIGKWLREAGVELRHPGFEKQGEQPFLERRRQNRYGNNWQGQRKKARQRDNHTCRSCGVREKELDRELDVHHIRSLVEFYSEEEDVMDFEKANQLSNLVSLCRVCHAKYENMPIAPVKGKASDE